MGMQANGGGGGTSWRAVDAYFVHVNECNENVTHTHVKK